MKATQDLIEEELLRLCQQGQFEALLLFNDEGIPMAEVGQCMHYSRDTLTALSVVFAQAVELVNDFQGDAPLNENSIRTNNKFRIVSRPLLVNELLLTLMAIVPAQLPYRKITNTAIRKIRHIMEQ